MKRYNRALHINPILGGSINTGTDQDNSVMTRYGNGYVFITILSMFPPQTHLCAVSQIFSDFCIPDQTPSVRFTFTGTIQAYTVPAGVYSLTIQAVGAGGGGSLGNSGVQNYAGQGASLSGDFVVTPGQVHLLLLFCVAFFCLLFIIL